MPQDHRTKGEKLLDRTWFDALEALREVIIFGEKTEDRIAASEVVLKYFISLGQSINEPRIPVSRRVK
jgi:hypothetical protein